MFKVPNDLETADHRVRVAAERREKTRGRLLEAALIVFGQHGVEASIVDEIIAIAGVARGTYYNYFQSNEELLQTVSNDAANEMRQAVIGRFKSPPDGPARIAAAIRSWRPGSSTSAAPSRRKRALTANRRERNNDPAPRLRVP